MILKSLNIKTIIDFTFEHQESFTKRIAENLLNNYEYKSIPL